MITDLLFATTLGLGQVPVPAAMPAAPFPGQAGQPGGMVLIQQPGTLPNYPTYPTRTFQDPSAPMTPGVDTAEADRKVEAKPAEEEDKPAPTKYFVMKTLEGSWLGQKMEEKRISVYGWTDMSYTPSSASINNQPMVWNDRANRFLLNQNWIRFEKSVDTEAKDVTWGWRVDTLIGSDYRFTLPRGLWNSQLENANYGTQNLYGVDLIQFYVNAYIPDWFKGTDVRAGRLFTPFGYESLEAISSPFVSKSYAFNWCPPFTHMGIQISPTFSDEWSGKFMLANGNDVFFDNSQEMRFVGAISRTTNNGDTVQTFGTSIGRGVFNSGQPFNPSTIGLQTEPAGRNNINVFDYVLTHKINEKASYAFETIYGYQSSVPANVPGGIIKTGVTEGTAHWGSIVNYLYYNFTDKFTGITRVEFFDDFEGQRTGFEGLYTAITVGANWKPTDSLIIRPEVRYDKNNYSNPFEGQNNLFTVGLDAIVRW